MGGPVTLDERTDGVVGGKEPGMEGWRDGAVEGNDAGVEVFIGMDVD